MDFFISNAFAEGGETQQGNPYTLIIMLVVFALIFYFMILRPQQKRAKEYKARMGSISVGSEVLTAGGIVGRVKKMNDNGFLVLSLNDTTEIVIKRDFISQILPKDTLKSL